MQCIQCSVNVPSHRQFCSKACIARHFAAKRKAPPTACQECESPVNLKGNKYCSRSCAAKANNRRKGFTTHYCSVCGGVAGVGWKNKRKYCENCQHHSKQYADWSLTTVGDLMTRLSTYQAHARIRALARRGYLAADKSRYCVACGYSKHFEVCHRKPVASFPRDTPVAVVNSTENLVALCPNCHWEFDHDLLVLAA